MNVDHSPGETLDEFAGQNAHIPGQHHQIRMESLNGIRQCNVKCRPVFVSFDIQRVRRNLR
ncbi:hypothetical protein D3C80_1653430 [compost metagenome]